MLNNTLSLYKTKKKQNNISYKKLMYKNINISIKSFRFANTFTWLYSLSYWVYNENIIICRDKRIDGKILQNVWTFSSQNFQNFSTK